MKLAAAVSALALATLFAALRPDWLLFALGASACLLASALLIVGVGRTFEWIAQRSR